QLDRVPVVHTLEVTIARQILSFDCRSRFDDCERRFWRGRRLSGPRWSAALVSTRPTARIDQNRIAHVALLELELHRVRPYAIALREHVIQQPGISFGEQTRLEAALAELVFDSQVIVRVLASGCDVSEAWRAAAGVSRPQHVNHSIVDRDCIRSVLDADAVLVKVPAVEIAPIEQLNPRASAGGDALGERNQRRQAADDGGGGCKMHELATIHSENLINRF